MKILLTLIFILSSMTIPVFSAAPTRQFSYTASTTIDPAQNNANENALYSYLQTGVDTYAVGSISNASISGSAGIAYSKLSLSASVRSTDIASGQGVLLPTGAIFFMITGSCPTGTTDVSSTYSNKYVKINATAGTSAGVVLTGTTDATAITQANLPSYNLSFTRYDGNGAAATGVQGTTNGDTAQTQNVASAGSGTGHTHTLSTASTLEPSSVTMKACLVS